MSEKYEIFTSHVVGWTKKEFRAGDTIPSIGFGAPDYKVWKVDHENKRYYVEEI